MNEGSSMQLSLKRLLAVIAICCHGCNRWFCRSGTPEILLWSYNTILERRRVLP